MLYLGLLYSLHCIFKKRLREDESNSHVWLTVDRLKTRLDVQHKQTGFCQSKFLELTTIDPLTCYPATRDNF